MEITWLGHACFLIKDSKGRRLLTDPFDSSVGYPSVNERADVVTVSHQHFDHNYTEDLPGVPEVISKCGLFYSCDIPINGIPSYHDKERGAKRGENIIFTFEMDGYKFCHLGDLGHPLSQEDIDRIGKIDVLFIPVGGNYTIDSKEAADIARTIDSHIVIPMHYKTPALTFPLDGVEEFVINMRNGVRVGSHTLELNVPLKEHNKVTLLEYQS